MLLKWTKNSFSVSRFTLKTALIEPEKRMEQLAFQEIFFPISSFIIFCLESFFFLFSLPNHCVRSFIDFAPKGNKIRNGEGCWEATSSFPHPLFLREEWMKRPAMETIISWFARGRPYSTHKAAINSLTTSNSRGMSVQQAMRVSFVKHRVLFRWECFSFEIRSEVVDTCLENFFLKFFMIVMVNGNMFKKLQCEYNKD